MSAKSLHLCKDILAKENARVADFMKKREGSLEMDNGQILEKYTLKDLKSYLKEAKGNGEMWADTSFSVLYTDGTQAFYGEFEDTSKIKLTGIKAIITDNGSTTGYAGTGVKIFNMNETEAFAKMTRYGTSKYEDDWRMDFE